MEASRSTPATTARRKTHGPRADDAYGVQDSVAGRVLDLATATRRDLVRHLDLPEPVADAIVEARKSGKLQRPTDVAGVRGVTGARFARLAAGTALPGEDAFHVASVEPAGGHVHSGRPFGLVAAFGGAGESPVVLAAVTVQWRGQPFVVEQEVNNADRKRGSVRIQFDRRRTLPVGVAEFAVALHRADGAVATFRRTIYVLPSNPLSLSLGPAGATVTGTWSARGDHDPATDTFLTQVMVTIANGDPRAVTMDGSSTWSFWDGGVGTGTKIEAGSLSWGGSFAIAAFSTWQGTASFSSPAGSPIHGLYARKEDMAIEIRMRATDGREIAGQITTRVMAAFGVNIIKVGSFTAEEHADLYAAVDQTRVIFEARDMTFRGVDRRIISDAQAGGFTILDSDTEYRDMLEAWSCANDFIDVFVVQAFNYGGFNGFAGAEPGPASKGGRTDGVAADKSGFVDAAGKRRLDVTVLGRLIGHELGHYLGLPHTTDADRLMLANTSIRGTTLTYDEYRTMFPHGYVVFL